MTTDLVMGTNVLVAAMMGALTLANPASVARVDVTEHDGIYNVSASFAVTEAPHVVIAVLTDFERIPHFMPDMEISKVVGRSAAGIVVEQQAVSRFMLFSKRVHLLLDVREDQSGIRFRDRCGKSFATYSGSWKVSEKDNLTVVDYQLSAKPTFEVPAFVLKRLLKRDSALLIDRIQVEITERVNRRK